MSECCGNCKYHKPMADEFICDNEESEGYGLSASFDDYCAEFEEREGERERFIYLMQWLGLEQRRR